MQYGVKMGSINLKNLQNNSGSQQNYTYTDISLDLAQEPFNFIIGNRTVTGSGRDIKIAYDINAIKNSITNLFNTVPGERLLLPDYGCDLRQFVFEPVSQSTASRITRTIRHGIQAWEPRVRIVNLLIDGYEDQGYYVITLVLEVPLLGATQRLSISGTLNQQGYIIQNGN